MENRKTKNINKDSMPHKAPASPAQANEQKPDASRGVEKNDQLPTEPAKDKDWSQNGEDGIGEWSVSWS